MLRNDVIYNLLFRFRNIDFNNINMIYFAIKIIVVIATTLFEILIVVIFVFKLIIVIVINVDIVFVVIVVFERSILKLIAFDFDMKRRFIMSALFDKF